MKREILFNAWIESLGVFLYDITIYPSGDIGLDYDEFIRAIPKPYKFIDDFNAVMHIDEYKDVDERILNINQGEDWIFINSNDVELLQYIGLSDKYGNKIFEGNEIKGYKKNRMLIEGHIKYSSKNAAFIVATRSFGVGAGLKMVRLNDLTDFEITGSVHESKSN